MAETSGKVKFNIGAFLCYTLSVILAYVCYFIYAYLPSSDFANSVGGISGEETVYVFGISFITGILSALIFAVMSYCFRKYFYKLSYSDRKIGNFKMNEATLEWISLIFSVLLFATLCTSAVLSFLYFKKCLDMLFPILAPTDDTKFKTFEYVILGNTIAHTVFYVLTVVKMAGIHWLDGLVCGISHIISKSKKDNEEVTQ